jgi:hypothetical protein
MLKVSANPIHFVDEANSGHAIFIRLTPHSL